MVTLTQIFPLASRRAPYGAAGDLGLLPPRGGNRSIGAGSNPKKIARPERAALLAEQLPATSTQAAADRDALETTLKARIKWIDNAQNPRSAN